MKTRHSRTFAIIGLAVTRDGDPFSVGRVDSNPLISDGDSNRLSVTPGAHPDRRIGIGVLRGIGHEVREDLSETCWICIDHQATLGDLDHHVIALLLQQRPRHLQRALDRSRDLDGFHTQLDLAGRDARDIQQVIDEPEHMCNLTLEDIPRARMDTVHPWLTLVHGPPWQPDREHRADVFSGVHMHRPSMRPDDLLDDEETKTEPARVGAAVMRTAKRVEQA